MRAFIPVVGRICSNIQNLIGDYVGRSEEHDRMEFVQEVSLDFELRHMVG